MIRRIDCPKCNNGSGVLECPRCGGRGYVSCGEKCFYCDGAGIILCDKCGGTGSIEVEIDDELATMGW